MSVSECVFVTNRGKEERKVRHESEHRGTEEEHLLCLFSFLFLLLFMCSMTSFCGVFFLVSLFLSTNNLQEEAGGKKVKKPRRKKIWSPEDDIRMLQVVSKHGAGACAIHVCACVHHFCARHLFACA